MLAFIILQSRSFSSNVFVIQGDLRRVRGFRSRALYSALAHGRVHGRAHGRGEGPSGLGRRRRRGSRVKSRGRLSNERADEGAVSTGLRPRVLVLAQLNFEDLTVRRLALGRGPRVLGSAEAVGQ